MACALALNLDAQGSNPSMSNGYGYEENVLKGKYMLILLEARGRSKMVQVQVTPTIKKKLNKNSWRTVG